MLAFLFRKIYLVNLLFQPTAMKANNHSDAVYYEQLLPHLIESLNSYKLFWDFCEPGEFYLARFEDRLAWIQILECGHNYVQMQMKGLELQETSCHTIEASIIDHIIESAIDTRTNTLAPWFNTNLFYTITPQVSVPVLAYSGLHLVHLKSMKKIIKMFVFV